MASQCKWKSFCLGDLFDIDNLWVYGKNKQYKTHLDYPNINSIPVVSGTVSNNGVNYYTIDNLDKNEIFSDCLTINTRGQAGQCFYHDGKFCLANNILAMPMPGLNKNTQLFFAVAISKLPYGDNYSNYPTKESLKKDCIMLPSTPNGTPDFDYMTQYISKLETQYISELETYLKVTGLDDYTLTDRDKDVLSRMADGRVPMGEFRIGDLFEYENTGNILIHSVTYDNDGYPFVTAKYGDNGIVGKIKVKDTYKIMPGNCIFVGGKTFTVSYQADSFVSNDSHNFILKSKSKELTGRQYLFFVSSIIKTGEELFTWGSAVTGDKLLKRNITLPITLNGTPDYVFMEQYIRAVEKQTIAKLYDSHTMEIQTAKEIIDSDI